LFVLLLFEIYIQYDVNCYLSGTSFNIVFLHPFFFSQIFNEKFILYILPTSQFNVIYSIFHIIDILYSSASVSNVHIKQSKQNVK